MKGITYVWKCQETGSCIPWFLTATVEPNLEGNLKFETYNKDGSLNPAKYMGKYIHEIKGKQGLSYFDSLYKLKVRLENKGLETEDIRLLEEKL